MSRCGLCDTNKLENRSDRRAERCAGHDYGRRRASARTRFLRSSASHTVTCFRHTFVVAPRGVRPLERRNFRILVAGLHVNPFHFVTLGVCHFLLVASAGSLRNRSGICHLWVVLQIRRTILFFVARARVRLIPPPEDEKDLLPFRLDECRCRVTFIVRFSHTVAHQCALAVHLFNRLVAVLV